MTPPPPSRHHARCHSILHLRARSQHVRRDRHTAAPTADVCAIFMHVYLRGVLLHPLKAACLGGYDYGWLWAAWQFVGMHRQVSI